MSLTRKYGLFLLGLNFFLSLSPSAQESADSGAGKKKLYLNCRLDYSAQFGKGKDIEKKIVRGTRLVIDLDDQDKMIEPGEVFDQVYDQKHGPLLGFPQITLSASGKRRGDIVKGTVLVQVLRGGDVDYLDAVATGLLDQKTALSASLNGYQDHVPFLFEVDKGGKVHALSAECKVTSSPKPLPSPKE